VELLLLLIDVKAWRLNFRTIEPVLHPSRWEQWKQWQNVQSRSLSSGSTTTIDNRCLCQRLNFRTFEPVLHLSCWVEEEKLLPLSLLWALISIYCKAERISLDQVLAVEFLNFASFEPVLHSSRSVWKLGSVQSSHISSGITTRNQSAVELILALVFYFKTFEPVQHPSRSVESVEEASNLGMFPVE